MLTVNLSYPLFSPPFRVLKARSPASECISKIQDYLFNGAYLLVRVERLRGEIGNYEMSRKGHERKWLLEYLNAMLFNIYHKQNCHELTYSSDSKKNE